MKSKLYYMHTINDRPGEFAVGMVCFSGRDIQLVGSLRQIRREQRISGDRDKAHGKIGEFRYGYVTVRLPQPLGKGGE